MALNGGGFLPDLSLGTLFMGFTMYLTLKSFLWRTSKKKHPVDGRLAMSIKQCIVMLLDLC